MADKHTMDVIENTLDTVEGTFDTLERIPKAHLNGTTKQQQILILLTVSGVSFAAGVAVATVAIKGIRLRRKKKIVDIPVVEAGTKG